MNTSEHSGRPGLRAHRLGSTTTPAASASASSPMRMDFSTSQADPRQIQTDDRRPASPIVTVAHRRHGRWERQARQRWRHDSLRPAGKYTVAAAKAGDVQQGINSKVNNKEPIGNFGVAWGLVRAWVLVPAWNLVPAWVLVATMGGAMGLVVPWVAPA